MMGILCEFGPERMERSSRTDESVRRGGPAGTDAEGVPMPLLQSITAAGRPVTFAFVHPGSCE